MDDQTTRLNRIEEKLDKVGEAIISLARMEERMITLFRRMDSYDQNQNVMEGRVTKIEVAHATSNEKVHWVDKFLWIFIAALISGSLYFGK
jgi:hypothetical protein